MAMANFVANDTWCYLLVVSRCLLLIPVLNTIYEPQIRSKHFSRNYSKHLCICTNH